MMVGKKEKNEAKMVDFIDSELFLKQPINEARAQKLLAIFVAQLPAIQKEINRYTQAGNLLKLDETLHRLLEACIYCNTPRLQEVLLDFHQVVACINEIDRTLLQIYLDEFNTAVEEVLAMHETQV